MKLLQKVFHDSGITLRPLHFWGVAVLYWGSFALVGFVQSSAYWSLQGSRGFTGTETLDLLLRALLWLLSTPLILYLAYRAPITSFQRGQLGRNLAVHLLAQFGLNLLITCIDYLLLYKLMGLVVGRTWGHDGVWASMLLRQSMSLTMYLLLVCSYGAVAHAHRNQDLHHQNARYELANEQLKSQLAGAQLQALKMQLNPHFLFNTHHAIIGLLLEHENERAIAMVTSLSDLLRAVMANGDAQLIPLREEMQFVTKYLHIQQIRFEDRLRVELAVGADAQDCLFPQFLLQPLVENAVVHGLEQLLGDAVIRIAAHLEEDYLVVEISDNGPGISHRAAAGRPVAEAGRGIGLSNTKARLEKLYHGCAQLTLTHPASGGTVVALRVPQAPKADLPDAAATLLEATA